jgi:hypothetical protein
MGVSIGGTISGLDIGGIGSGIDTLNQGAIWYRINGLFEQMIPKSRQAKKVEYTNWYSWEVAKKAVSAGSLEIQMRKIIRQKMLNTAGSGIKTGITVGTGGWTGYFVNIGSSAWGPNIYDWLRGCTGSHSWKPLSVEVWERDQPCGFWRSSGNTPRCGGSPGPISNRS